MVDYSRRRAQRVAKKKTVSATKIRVRRAMAFKAGNVTADAIRADGHGAEPAVSISATSSRERGAIESTISESAAVSVNPRTHETAPSRGTLSCDPLCSRYYED